MQSKHKAEYHYYMDEVRNNLSMAQFFANRAKNAESDLDAMVYDYHYIEHTARAVFCLTHARKLRIKEKTNYGNQF